MDVYMQPQGRLCHGTGMEGGVPRAEVAITEKMVPWSPRDERVKCWVRLRNFKCILGLLVIGDLYKKAAKKAAEALRVNYWSKKLGRKGNRRAVKGGLDFSVCE